jgi:hypothetical protein
MTRWAAAIAVAASAALVACANGTDRAQETVTAVRARGATEMTCNHDRGAAFPTVADLASLSTIIITARATTSRTTTVTAPLTTEAPKSPPAPTTIPSAIGPNQWTPPEDRRDDPALQGRGYTESYFTDTTIEVETVLKGPSDLSGRTITNRTNGDDIHECTTRDPPATVGTSQLFFLSHDAVSDTYFTTTGSLSGRFEIKDGRVIASEQPNSSLNGKTIAEVRGLI